MTPSTITQHLRQAWNQARACVVACAMVAVLVASFVPQAQANVTYTYIGKPFDVEECKIAFPGPDFVCVPGSVEGFVIFDDRVTPDYTGAPHVGDGVVSHTLISLGVSMPHLDVTDAERVYFVFEKGTITYWDVTASQGTQSAETTNLAIPYSGAFDGAYLSAGNPFIFGLSFSPGIWSRSSSLPPTPPTASFVFTPQAPVLGEVVTFTSTSTDSDGRITNQRWDFGDDQGATGATVSHSYTREGGFTVTLTVTDDQGLTDLTSQQIYLTTFCKDLEQLREIANARKGTLDELYAKFWSCLNESACREYRSTGENGTAGGFNRFVFEYMAAHPKQSALNVRCSGFGLFTSNPLVLDAWECFQSTGKYHFDNELTPAFRAYCEEVTPEQYDAWDEQHKKFIESINLPCFDETLKDTGTIIPLDESIAIEYAQAQTQSMADELRENTQIICSSLQKKRGNARAIDLANLPIQLPNLTPPLTREELFSEDLASAGTLRVTTRDETLFFISEGTQIPLVVTKRNQDGSTTDVTASPETVYSAPISKELVSITADGRLSILGSPSPFATNRPVLHVFVQNGSDRGIGQFAIVPKDIDGDRLADSYEVRFGLDPHTPNDLNSDVDSDGLSDWTELMIKTQPTVADTDGDGLSDKEEFDAGSDPRDVNSVPATLDGTVQPGPSSTPVGTTPDGGQTPSVPTPAPSSAGQTPSGGGGGCTINPGAGFDPWIMGIVGFSLVCLLWRHIRKP